MKALYLLPNIDLAWLRRFTMCNRLGRAQVARHNLLNVKNDLSLQLPLPYPITALLLLFAFGRKTCIVIGNLPIAGKEGG